MTRRVCRLLAVLLALPLAAGCRNKEFERNAPELARANLRQDRIAVAGVVSDAPDLPDTTGARERWSDLLLNQLTRERFGRLPVTSHRELRAALGEEEYQALLDSYRGDGACGPAWLDRLKMALGNDARFVVFGRIQEHRITNSRSNDKEKKTETFGTTRHIRVRLQFYDLTTGRLAWDHIAYGVATANQDFDDSDLLEGKPGDSILGSIAKAVVNAAAKPDMTYPGPPDLDATIANAFDDVGNYLGESQKRREKRK